MVNVKTFVVGMVAKELVRARTLAEALAAIKVEDLDAVGGEWRELLIRAESMVRVEI